MYVSLIGEGGLMSKYIQDLQSERVGGRNRILSQQYLTRGITLAYSSLIDFKLS